MSQVHAKIAITWFQHREVNRHVGLGAGVRLHVGMIGAEQFFGAGDRQRFDFVDEFTAAVISLARITFGIFVGHHRALGFEHRFANDVLRRDEFEIPLQAAGFPLNRGEDLRVYLFKK